jgi:hypothetical protein
MHEETWKGTETLTDHPTDEQIQDALSNPKNRMVAFHKPGSVLELSSGEKYEVQADGKWRKREPIEDLIDKMSKPKFPTGQL